MLYTAQNIKRPSGTGFGANPFTGSQYIIDQGPAAPPFALPTMVNGKATGFTQPSAEAFQEAIGWQQPASSGEALALWNEYIQNAYHGNLPSRLREVDASIREGAGLSDHMVNRIMYEDAMWGGSLQDVPTSAVLASRDEYPGGNPLAYSGGPGSGNTERLWEGRLGTDVYQAPIQTDPAALYGPLTSIGQNLGMASDRGVPTAAIQQAADFDANLQAARYEQGDLPTNTGPGLFTLPLSFVGPAGVFLAGAAGSVASDNPFGVLATSLGTAIADGANFSRGGFENPDALNFDSPVDGFGGGEFGASQLGLSGDSLGTLNLTNAAPLGNLPMVTGFETINQAPVSLAAMRDSLYAPKSLTTPTSKAPGLLTRAAGNILSNALQSDGETQSAGVAPIINVGGGASPGYVPPAPPPPPDLPVYFDYDQNPFITRALGGI